MSVVYVHTDSQKNTHMYATIAASTAEATAKLSAVCYEE